MEWDELIFDPFVVPPGPIRELRERWGIGAEKQIVLHAARLTSLKGHRQVIEAASCLYREGALENAVIIFAGDMAGKDTYQARANTSHPSTWIRRQSASRWTLQ